MNTHRRDRVAATRRWTRGGSRHSVPARSVGSLQASAAPTAGAAAVIRPGEAAWLLLGTLGASRFRRRWQTRADARRRGPRRLNPCGQHDRCREHGPDQRGCAARRGGGQRHGCRDSVDGRRGGVILAAGALTPMSARWTDRWTAGDRPRSMWCDVWTPHGDASRKQNRPEPTTKTATRADSSEVKRHGGRGFDSPRLHLEAGSAALIRELQHEMEIQRA